MQCLEPPSATSAAVRSSRRDLGSDISSIKALLERLAQQGLPGGAEGTRSRLEDCIGQIRLRLHGNSESPLWRRAVNLRVLECVHAATQDLRVCAGQRARMNDTHLLISAAAICLHVGILRAQLAPDASRGECAGTSAGDEMEIVSVLPEYGNSQCNIAMGLDVLCVHYGEFVDAAVLRMRRNLAVSVGADAAAAWRCDVVGSLRGVQQLLAGSPSAPPAPPPILAPGVVLSILDQAHCTAAEAVLARSTQVLSAVGVLRRQLLMCFGTEDGTKDTGTGGISALPTDVVGMYPVTHLNQLLLSSIRRRLADSPRPTSDSGSGSGDSVVRLAAGVLCGFSDLCYVLLSQEVRGARRGAGAGAGDAVHGGDISVLEGLLRQVTGGSGLRRGSGAAAHATGPVRFDESLVQVMEYIPYGVLNSLPCVLRRLVEYCLFTVCHENIQTMGRAGSRSGFMISLCYAPVIWNMVRRQDVSVNHLNRPSVGPLSAPGGGYLEVGTFTVDEEVYALNEHYIKYKCFENIQQQSRRHATLGSPHAAAEVPQTVATVDSASNATVGITDPDSDGLQSVERVAYEWRFTEDERMHEVCRLVRSSRAHYLKLEKTPETTAAANDIAAFRTRQQYKLLSLCRRALCLSIGRGMITLGSLNPQLAETMPIPPLPLFGRTPPNNSLVYLDTSSAPPALTRWPEFHNAVAACLRLSSIDGSASLCSVGVASSKGGNVTKSWVQYVKASNVAPVMGANNQTGSKTNTLAGILLALGLMRNLGVLSTHDILDYLTMGNETISVGVLIGLSATKLGTQDALFTKTLCLHMPSLLPAPLQAGGGAGATGDVEISALVQTAALAGFGLLYCESCNRQIIEFLLGEVSQPANSNHLESRESLCLTASWALGMILLGRGASANSGGSTGVRGGTANAGMEVEDPIPALGQSGAHLHGVADLKIEDRLLLLLEGGVAPVAAATHGHGLGAGQDLNSRSSRVIEGRLVNTSVTGPGAAIALGLMYLKSKNKSILKKLSPPQTAYTLTNIQPDLLLFRSLASCLVAWEGPSADGDCTFDVAPTDAWLSGCVPHAIRTVLFPATANATRSRTGASSSSDSAEGGEGESSSAAPVAGSVLTKSAAVPLYLALVGGSCLGLGLIYAGTGNAQARAVLLKQLLYLQKVRDNKDSSIACSKEVRPTVELSLVCTALGLSMAMAGTGDVAILRVLRELRWKVDDSIYGTHMALGMCIGFLFLHGGQASLRRDNVAIGCLLISVLPRFPNRTVDNQYHLQALRHMYVLGIEWRSLRLVDADTNESVNGADIEVVLRSGKSYVCKSPCLLQELCTIRCIRLLQHAHSPTGQGAGAADISSLNREYFPACLTINSDSDSESVSRPILASGGVRGATDGVLPTLYIKKRARGAPARSPVATSRVVLGAPLSSPSPRQLTSVDATEIALLYELYSHCPDVRDLVHQQSLAVLRSSSTMGQGCTVELDTLNGDSLIKLVGLFEH